MNRERPENVIVLHRYSSSTDFLGTRGNAPVYGRSTEFAREGARLMVRKKAEPTQHERGQSQ